jgi:hypothetical protein
VREIVQVTSPGATRARSRAQRAAPPSRRRSPEQAARLRRTYRRRRIVAAAALLGFVGILFEAAQVVLTAFSSVDVQVVGLAHGSLVGKAAATDLVVKLPAHVSAVRLDGVDVTAAARAVDDHRELRPGTVAEGPHTVTVAVRRAMRPDLSKTVRFTADLTPPVLEVARPAPVAARAGTKITGRAEKGAVVSIDGRSVTVNREAFSLDLPSPAPTAAVLKAVDRAGNVTETTVRIPTVQPPVRAVHLTEIAWTTPSLKDPAMAMLDQKKVDTIQLDIKDEGGEVGYATTVALAREIGSVHDRFVLADAVKEIHDHGGRVIGRIVTYRDPRFAQVAWESGHKERVVQTPDGQRYGAYGGGFLNANDPVVRGYTTDLAVEAVKAGVDEILLDYVRRPDGALDGMRFPGIDREGDAEERAVEDVIVAHLAELHSKIRAEGGRLGASVFGIAATRPKEIAQDVTRMAEHLDYVAPMLYPSHWAKGEMGIPDPNKAPGETIRRSLAAFGQRIEGTGAALVPWLQDFSLGVAYGEPEVRAQIDAANDTGADGFLLWDASCTYTEAALDPKAGAAPGGA